MTESTENNVELFADDFRNSLFDENLLFFQRYDRDIYQMMHNHRPTEYRLCANNDGSPNILHVGSGSLVYPNSSESIAANDDRKIDGMEREFRFSALYLLRGDSRIIEISPVQMAAYRELLSISPLDFEIYHDDGGAECVRINREDFSFIPFLRVYGVGLGTHLVRLIQEKDIVYANITEPHPDLFFCSLFVIPWRAIFEYFSVGSRGLNLVVGKEAEDAVTIQHSFITEKFPLLTSSFYRLEMFSNSQQIRDLIVSEKKHDALFHSQLTSGWYDDQKIGLFNSFRNLKNNSKIYKGSKVKGAVRVFLVGSGPSLDASLDYIKQNSANAIIVACGTARSPLLAAGITPDFHVLQERVWTDRALDSAESEDERSAAKDICCLKLNVVSPNVDADYQSAFIFQKANDPGSSLLLNDFPVTQAVNPTVTNAGVAFVAALGAAEAFLFGIDYGSPKDHGRWHARATIWDQRQDAVAEKDKNYFEIQGNFGEQVVTTPLLHWSLNRTELTIERHNRTKWINVGPGASITGTKECAVEELPERLSLLDKRLAMQSMFDCFSTDYSFADVERRFQSTHRQSIHSYLDRLSEIGASEPSSRAEILSTLSAIYVAVDVGASDPQFMPSTLLAGGVKRLIENIYVQTSMCASDQQAALFFREAKDVLNQYYESIKDDIDHVIDCAREDIEIWHWSDGDAKAY